MSEAVHHQLTIPFEHAGQRLDQVLADLLEGYSRTRIKEWIDAGQVRVNGAQLRPKDKVLGGESVEINATLPDQVSVEPEQISLNIVHQDKHVLVLNKPAGLVVHPGAGNAAGTLQNALLHFDAKLSQVPRAGIVHRLDKDTTGLMVVARTVEAHTALVRMIEAREVEREYEAVCVGMMTGGGVVDAPIDRHPVDRLKMAVRESGREAVTHYRVVTRFRGHTHVRLKLESGRTHQIRVHMMHIHYPLVGDKVYGGRMLLPKGASPELIEALRGFKRQALHAARLAFEHPVSGKPIVNEAALPTDMQDLLGVLARDTAAAAAAKKR
ncbi:ribosomal large subunit pseudouridine synthase D [Steroidobacter agaridevorans]|uniref:Pseudouridine synthase n=1 Tax=Steroidobacter agaridevorans TaxID=2695856 RepID=A0A829Y933_9GAMM|nr:23S rRNA pseudouridine(1911/1915/1917) synthase RluD [Steroidobacter agaridevorans]GFE79082.1 ribosomal large subunit pseudouridine synthase D [Steroidobacter agaridevorans]GFE88238.1 ribosomal large subunit pseudouridine synthase D [Steroidobacter agaridevorans]